MDDSSKRTPPISETSPREASDLEPLAWLDQLTSTTINAMRSAMESMRRYNVAVSGIGRQIRQLAEIVKQQQKRTVPDYGTLLLGILTDAEKRLTLTAIRRALAGLDHYPSARTVRRYLAKL